MTHKTSSRTIIRNINIKRTFTLALRSKLTHSEQNIMTLFSVLCRLDIRVVFSLYKSMSSGSLAQGQGCGNQNTALTGGLLAPPPGPSSCVHLQGQQIHITEIACLKVFELLLRCVLKLAHALSKLSYYICIIRLLALYQNWKCNFSHFCLLSKFFSMLNFKTLNFDFCFIVAHFILVLAIHDFKKVPIFPRARDLCKPELFLRKW